MKVLLGLLGLVLLSAPALAQTGEVVVNVSGLSCTTQSGKTGFDATEYSVGGTLPTQSKTGTNTAAVPNLDALNISKGFDDCSAPLIRLFLGATTAPTLTLIQYGNSQLANTPILTITLNKALMTSYQVTGAAGVRPQEVLTFTYQTVCVTSVGQYADGSLRPPVTVCYDTAKRIVS